MKRQVQTNKQTGFSAIELLLVLLVVCILAGVGFYVFKLSKNNSANSTATNDSNAQTASMSDAGLIKKISTDIPSKFPTLSAKISASSVIAYKLTDYDFAVIADGNKNASLLISYASDDSGTHKVPDNFSTYLDKEFENAGFSQDTTQVKNSGTSPNGPTYVNHYFTKNNSRCQIAISESANPLANIDCADITAIISKSKELKPVYDSLSSDRKSSGDSITLLSGNIKASKTQGYRIVALTAGTLGEDYGGSPLAYYSKNDGPWIKLSSSPWGVDCSVTGDAKAAFKGESCIDTSGTEGTVQ